MSLKKKLTQHGFESNESFEHAVRCFLEAPCETLRCLNIDGQEGRHKTAFAYALGHALDTVHVQYYEFGLSEPVQPHVIRIVDGEEHVGEPVVASLDRAVNEACALSEAESVVLIVDQLQLADFKQEIRLLEFIKTSQWSYGDVTCYANKGHLLVFIVSDTGLSLMLQRMAYRIFLPQVGSSIASLEPADFNLNDDSSKWLQLLVELMSELNVSPLLSEYQRLIYDIDTFVCNDAQLKESIFARVSNIEYQHLEHERVKLMLKNVMHCYEDTLIVGESIEIEGPSEG